MSARDELRAYEQQRRAARLNGNGGPVPPSHVPSRAPVAAQNGQSATSSQQLRDRVTAALKLPSGGPSALDAEMHGRGPQAVVAIRLDDGSTLEFERFADMMNTTRLATSVIAITGQPVVFKAAECAEAAAAVVQLAKHHGNVTVQDLAREWGEDFLRRAEVLDVDMTDQRDRWGAFCRLDGMDPIAAARQTGQSVASASLVLRDPQGTRWVPSAWFHAHVRASVGAIGPAELVNRMSRAGWQRAGAYKGRVKATCPREARTITLPFYRVAAGWEGE